MRIEVKVTPKAAANRIIEAEGMWRVYVTAPADDGRANKAVTKILAKHFGVAPSAIEIVRGHNARLKLIDIHKTEDM
jgi:uncharacterized protein